MGKSGYPQAAGGVLLGVEYGWEKKFLQTGQGENGLLFLYIGEHVKNRVGPSRQRT